MSELLGKYQNGNYTVSIYSDGTKVRENDLDYLECAFPESFDLKITNRCHNGCAFCHENSTCNGKHGDIMNAKFIDNLHPYTEIAVGGGNPLEHPDLLPFLEKLKRLKMIPSMTVRQNDFMDNLDLMRRLRDEGLIYGIGISLTDAKQEGFLAALSEFPNAVVHVINGIVRIGQLMALARHGVKILVLGYKLVRRGETLYCDNNAARDRIQFTQNELYKYLPIILYNRWFDVVSFDNLAIQQLNPKRLLSDEAWNEMYMGDDGIDGEMTSASMFIDLVEGQFAKNSCDMERYPVTDDIEEMFGFLRGKK